MSFIAAAVIGGIGVVGGSLIAGGAAQSAANTQAGAAENAQAISRQEFNTITQQEQPFLQGGYGALSALNYGLGIGVPGQGGTAAGGPGGFGSLLAPFTADTFRQYSPAYQFQLQQGQQGVLNADAGSQGALSGAALKDLTSFNQNYANTAFNNAFNQYQTQQGNIYSRLAGLTQIGSSAAANLGAQGVQLAGQQAQSAQNIGTALAGGQVGAANAYGGALSSLGTLGMLTQNPYAYLGTSNDQGAGLYGASTGLGE